MLQAQVLQAICYTVSTNHDGTYRGGKSGKERTEQWGGEVSSAPVLMDPYPESVAGYASLDTHGIRDSPDMPRIAGTSVVTYPLNPFIKNHQKNLQEYQEANDPR